MNRQLVLGWIAAAGTAVLAVAGCSSTLTVRGTPQATAGTVASTTASTAVPPGPSHSAAPSGTVPVVAGAGSGRLPMTGNVCDLMSPARLARITGIAIDTATPNNIDNAHGSLDECDFKAGDVVVVYVIRTVHDGSVAKFCTISQCTPVAGTSPPISLQHLGQLRQALIDAPPAVWEILVQRTGTGKGAVSAADAATAVTVAKALEGR